MVFILRKPMFDPKCLDHKTKNTKPFLDLTLNPNLWQIQTKTNESLEQSKNSSLLNPNPIHYFNEVTINCINLKHENDKTTIIHKENVTKIRTRPRRSMKLQREIWRNPITTLYLIHVSLFLSLWLCIWLMLIYSSYSGSVT